MKKDSIAIYFILIENYLVKSSNYWIVRKNYNRLRNVISKQLLYMNIHHMSFNNNLIRYLLTLRRQSGFTTISQSVSNA